MQHISHNTTCFQDSISYDYRVGRIEKPNQIVSSTVYTLHFFEKYHNESKDTHNQIEHNFLKNHIFKIEILFEYRFYTY